MTPYEFATAIATEIEPLPIPKHPNGKVYAQLGDTIVDCAGSWVSVTGVSEQDLVPGASHCGRVEMADVQIVAAFECALTSDDTGITDPAKLAAVAQQQDAIGAALVAYVRDLTANTIVESTFTGVQYQNTGGLGIVTVGFTTPIP